MADTSHRFNGNTLRAIIEWDIVNWSLALKYWQHHTEKDLRKVTALEIGSRGGGISLWLALQGAMVVCSDLGEPTLQARELHKRYGVSSRIRYEAIDASTMIKADQYDLIIFKSVLGGIGYGENRVKQQQTIAAIHRALKPDGELFFAENLTASPLHRFLRRRFTSWGARWRYITLEELSQFASVFSGVKYTTVGFLGVLGRTERQRAVLGWLDRALFAHLVPQAWRYIVIGVARK